MTGTSTPPATAGTTTRRLRLGTRASALALAQSEAVAEALRSRGVEVELVTVRTLGDERPPDTAWGEGAFVGALETALLAGEVDLAVHSAKDVPTSEDPRLVIAAWPRREDPRDALVCREPGLRLDTLPPGSRVGTDSPRRTAFLRARRPDLVVHPLHGNVDTRLRRLDAGETDALVLAVAGLRRLGLAGRISEVLAPEVIPPAPGQGALAVQCRADDEATKASLAALDDPPTRLAVETERAFLRASGGGCRAPIGALAVVAGSGDAVIIAGGSAGTEAGAVAGETGTAGGIGAPVDEPPIVVRGEARGPLEDRVAVAAGLAARLGAELAARQAATVAARGEPAATAAPAAGSATVRRPGRPRALVTRAGDQSDALVEALAGAGFEVVAIPTIELRAVEPGGPLDAAAARLERYDWVVVTSANGARAILSAATRAGADPGRRRWAAVGPSTAAVLAASGIEVAFVPSRSSGNGLAAELPLEAGQRVLLARADIADERLPAGLRERGAVVEEVVAYRTVEAPETSRQPLRAAFAAGPFEALVFTSGSTVRGLLALLAPHERRVALRSLACCIGPVTGRIARESGFGRVVEASGRSATELAATLAAELAATLPGAPGEGRQAEIVARAERIFPGGVNSPVRAFRSVGRPPLVLDAGEGPRVRDADGRWYVDWIGAWGPAILGHAHPAVVEAVREAARRGFALGATSPAEVELGEAIRAAMPALEKLRFTSSGTEAAMSALRLARGATGRDLVLKFAGGYHGHSDGLLVEAGSGVATLALPGSAGVPEAIAGATIVVPWNDLDGVRLAFERHPGRIAAVIVEPVAANIGVVPPAPGFLSGLRELTAADGALLVFDEVITGFRVAHGGAQARYGVRPDLTVLGKIIGGGLPVGAYGGRAELMDLVAPAGPVYQAGTLSGHPLTMAAGLATLRELRPERYEELEATGAALEAGLREAAAAAGAAAAPVAVQRVGSLLTVFFRPTAPRTTEEAMASDRAAFARFFGAMLDAGVLLPPSQFEAWFISLAHGPEVVEETIAAARIAFRAGS